MIKKREEEKRSGNRSGEVCKAGGGRGYEMVRVKALWRLRGAEGLGGKGEV